MVRLGKEQDGKMRCSVFEEWLVVLLKELWKVSMYGSGRA